MLDERKDSNTQENDESIQITRKPSRDRPKKVNTKSSKANISKN